MRWTRGGAAEVVATPHHAAAGCEISVYSAANAEPPERAGLFRFPLDRADTRSHPHGGYRLEVEAADIRGNASRKHLEPTFTNAAV
jgi:hypothetical protein